MKRSTAVTFPTSDKFSLLSMGYYLLLIFLVMMVFVMPLINKDLLRIPIYMFAFLNIGIFSLTLRPIFQNERDSLSLNLILIVLFFLFVSILAYNAWSIYIIAISIGYISSYLTAYYTEYIPLTKKTVNFITIVCIATSIIFIFYFFSPFAYRYAITYQEAYIITEISSVELTLGYQNPNTTASLLASILMILIILFKIYKNIFVKIFLLCLAFFMAYMLYLTKSRSSFFAAILFFIILFSGIKIKITKKLIIAILLSGLGFIFVYNYLFVHNIGLDWEFLGKPFYSGRQNDLANIFNAASNSWIIGNIKEYQYDNLLNGMLSIYASGGIINVILYVWFFSHNISKRYDSMNNYSYYSLMALVCIYFQAYAEGNFMVTGSYFSVLLSIFYVLSNVRYSELN